MAAGDNPFEIVRIRGKGLGIVALRDISAGDIIFEETPFLPEPLAIPWSNDTIATAFSMLPNASKQALLALDNRWPDDGEYGIFKTNALPYVVYDAEEGEILGYTGLLILGSRINHSCSPNLAHYFVSGPATGRFIFRALRTIQAGDELCISYIHPLLESHDDRRGILKDVYDFDCLCTTCSMKSSTGDANREAVKIMCDDIVDVIMENEQAALCNIARIQQIFNLLQQEGLLEIYEPIVSFDAFKAYISLKDTVQAQYWGQKAWETQLRLKGPNDYWALELQEICRDELNKLTAAAG